MVLKTSSSHIILGRLCSQWEWATHQSLHLRTVKIKFKDEKQKLHSLVGTSNLKYKYQSILFISEF